MDAITEANGRLTACRIVDEDGYFFRVRIVGERTMHDLLTCDLERALAFAEQVETRYGLAARATHDHRRRYLN